jgi:protein O-GlcNAc transferase
MSQVDQAKALYAKAAQYILRNENEKGLAYLEEAIKLEPGNALYLCDAGRALIKLRRYQEARRQFSNAREIEPEELGSLLGLGNCAAAENKFEESIEYYDQVIRAVPGYWGGYYFKAISLCDLRRHKEALPYIQTCLKLGPPSSITQQLEVLNIKIRHTLGPRGQL